VHTVTIVNGFALYSPQSSASGGGGSTPQPEWLPGNVHAPADLFVGREQEIAAIDDAFARGVRLVTVVGAGGIGKTRVAHEYATALCRSSKVPLAEIWFVDLSEARSLERLVGKVAAAMKISLRPGSSADMNRIGQELAGRGSVLLWLDNFEHLREHAAASVGALRALAPETRILVTSRSVLGLAGEHRVEVPPLELHEAEELFVARARAVAHGSTGAFEDACERDYLRRVLARLEGIPLAIELAAARVTVLSLPQLCERLGRSFDILRSMRADTSARHATLHRTLEWSWALLSAAEQNALAQCGVFRGSFTIDAAEAIIDLGEASSVVDVLHRLREASLLRAANGTRSDALRLHLFGAVREFAEHKLAELGRIGEVRERHSRYYAELAAGVAAGAAYAVGPVESLDRIAPETDNLVAVLERNLIDQPALAVPAGLALAELLFLRGPKDRHEAVVQQVSEAAERAGDPEMRVRAILAQSAARRLWQTGKSFARSLEQARDLAEQIGNVALQALAMARLGVDAVDQGDLSSGEKWLGEALELQEQCGDRFGEGISLGWLALIAQWSGRMDDAIELYDRAMLVSRAAGNRRWQAIVLRNRAVVHSERDDIARAVRDTEAALAIHRELGDPDEPHTLMNMAWFAAEMGELKKARDYCETVCALARRGALSPRLANPYVLLGWLHLVDGDANAAEVAFEEGIYWSAGAANRTHRRGQSVAGRGVARLMHGSLSAAIDDLRAAIRQCAGAGGEVTDQPLFEGFLAVASAMQGELDSARDLVSSARSKVQRFPSARFARTLDVIQGFVNWAQAKAAREAGDTGTARELEERAARCLNQVEILTERGSAQPRARSHLPFLEELVAATMLGRAMGTAAAASRWIYVGPKNSWVQIGAQERIDLRRRPVLRRLVRTLVEARQATPGREVSSGELIAAAWPGDRSERRAIENRLWVALSSLRKLGFDQVLKHDGSGYFLDPDVPVSPGAEN
jgi:predicted ATPase